jgi:predicted kinase
MMKPTLIMCKGLPASGKTTWAREQAKEFGWKIVNKDLLREMLDGGVWSKKNESTVLLSRDTLVDTLLNCGYSVVSDDTNFQPEHETCLKEIARKREAGFEVKDFTDVPLGTCLERDASRAKSVGIKVITGMYNRYLKPKPTLEITPPYNPSLPNAIIVDIDGTIAYNNGHRGHYEWGKVYGDGVRKSIKTIITSCVKAMSGMNVIFLSGRDSICYDDTMFWLKENTGFENFSLHMRAVGDSRPDEIVKEELYRTRIHLLYNIIAIFDDRAKVCRMWKRLGFGSVLFRVGMIDEDEF